MDAETIELVLAYLKRPGIETLDITGGAPEMNAHFHRLVTAARTLDKRVIDRCNLTILEEPGYENLAEFLAAHEVEVVASLPCYTEENVDQQRGKGTYDASIRALRRLNVLGYGLPESRLTLNLVYNPLGASLPPSQVKLKVDYTRVLRERWGIYFNDLFVLANMPVGRFGSLLVSKGQFQGYLATLQAAHQPANLPNVMCRTLISVDWRGFVYDCDFNQMLDLPLQFDGKPRPHLRDLLNADLEGGPITVAEHCYGCTAGQGSSCGGALN
jgi:radical SAM/Cys-rich protein